MDEERAASLGVEIDEIYSTVAHLMGSKYINDFTRNGKTYRVKTHRQHDLVTKFDGGNFYFHEAVGDFTFTTIPDLGCEPLPGAKVINAKGTIEMGWNKDSSRWGTYDKDKD